MINGCRSGYWRNVWTKTGSMFVNGMLQVPFGAGCRPNISSIFCIRSMRNKPLIEHVLCNIHEINKVIYMYMKGATHGPRRYSTKKVEEVGAF